MSDGTKIEWTDATANAINGCTVVSPGCANCYAMKQAHRFPIRQGLTRQSPSGMTWTGEVRLNERVFEQVLRWTKPRRIFWNAHGDTFHKDVPDEWIDRMFAVMALTPQHTHQVLTKRPERMRDYVRAIEGRPDQFGVAMAAVVRAAGLPRQRGIDAIDDWRHPLPNVWLGVSVEDQQRADERIPVLLATPAAVRWLSMEPLLGPVTLNYLQPVDPACEIDALNGTHGIIRPHRGKNARVDWVVLGGESGPGARPMHPDWARQVRDQCAAAGVPFHFKQWGNWLPAGQTASHTGLWSPSCGSSLLTTKKNAGRLLDGVQHDGCPA